MEGKFRQKNSLGPLNPTLHDPFCKTSTMTQHVHATCHMHGMSHACWSGVRTGPPSCPSSSESSTTCTCYMSHACHMPVGLESGLVPPPAPPPQSLVLHVHATCHMHVTCLLVWSQDWSPLLPLLLRVYMLHVTCMSHACWSGVRTGPPSCPSSSESSTTCTCYMSHACHMPVGLESGLVPPPPLSLVLHVHATCHMHVTCLLVRSQDWSPLLPLLL